MEKERRKVNAERKRQRFSKEYKLAAVKLLQSGTKPGTLIAMELGIQRNLLYKWAETLKQHGGNTGRITGSAESRGQVLQCNILFLRGIIGGRPRCPSSNVSLALIFPVARMTVFSPYSVTCHARANYQPDRFQNIR
jgi:hypothetical protein